MMVLNQTPKNQKNSQHSFIQSVSIAEQNLHVRSLPGIKKLTRSLSSWILYSNVRRQVNKITRIVTRTQDSHEVEKGVSVLQTVPDCLLVYLN